MWIMTKVHFLNDFCILPYYSAETAIFTNPIIMALMFQEISDLHWPAFRAQLKRYCKI